MHIRLSILSIGILVTSCTPKPIEISNNLAPIDALNPLDSTPMAQAWCDDSQITMAVDTGAIQRSLLFSPTVKKLGGRLRGSGSMRTTNLDVMLKNGDQPLEQKQAVVMVEQAPYDGILGWDVIKDNVWRINYPNREHQFTTDLPKQVKNWKNISLVKGSEYAQIKDPNGKQVILDTGAQYAVYIAKKDWEAFKLSYPDAFVSVYNGYSPAAGGFYALECMYIKNYNVGNLTFNNIVACESFADPKTMGLSKEIDVILGIEALFQREFWIDGKNHKIYFSKERHNAPLAPAFNLIGGTFTLDKSGKPPYRAVVAQWSPAWVAGLRNGDILLSINGQKNQLQHMIEYVTTQEGAKANVKVLRKNKLATIHWIVPKAPEPGEYYPTTPALTDEEFEIQQKEWERKQEEKAKQALENATPHLQPNTEQPQTHAE